MMFIVNVMNHYLNKSSSRSKTLSLFLNEMIQIKNEEELELQQ